MADWATILGLWAAAMLAMAVALLVMAAFPAALGRATIFSGHDEGAIFLFDGEALVDASPGARALLHRADGRGPPFLRMLSVLGPHFPNLEQMLSSLPSRGALSLTAVPAQGTALSLQAEYRGGLTRLTLIDSGVDAGLAGPDPMLHRALADEVEQLRAIATQAPLPIWRERPDGEVIWANAQYLQHAMETLPQGEELGWPLPQLFDRTTAGQGAMGQRYKLLSSDAASWFDLTTVAGDDETRLVYALSADAAVQAEKALRDFMQTLTQTFAHLPIGLAIFDRNRQLHMFNPALLDLTGLPADFLSMRPSLLSVLDALRDAKMLPEPKDYSGWRRQMMDMEKAAAAGLYEEMWSLSGGQTYRLMARPHPNGGLAMMIEDVSTETLRNRRYRAQLELGHAVIDTMDEAVVVFGPHGQVVFANPAYEALWGHDPSGAMSDRGYRKLCDDWRAVTSPTPVWARAEAFMEAADERQDWRGEARLADGRHLQCRFASLPGGATLAAFRAGDPVLADATLAETEEGPLIFRPRHRG